MNQLTLALTLTTHTGTDIRISGWIDYYYWDTRRDTLYDEFLLDIVGIMLDAIYFITKIFLSFFVCMFISEFYDAIVKHYIYQHNQTSNIRISIYCNDDYHYLHQAIKRLLLSPLSIDIGLVTMGQIVVVYYMFNVNI